MIISVEKAKALIGDFNGWTDTKIDMKLEAIEQTIRAYTNNNFQDRGYRITADIRDGALVSAVPFPFSVGDTVQISESQLNSNKLYTILAVADNQTFTVGEDIKNEDSVLVTKIVYPADVVDCCVNLLEWEKKYGGKIGVKSETLSRHSVTYEDSTGLFRGYPKGILSALWHYRKARC